ncbi:hypothetical protein ADIMK_1064 [Marinobacterium lacunae]|uniref:Uncharacterized protein n=1 Tax=Marinobacterium lacunae TaxID=1232683 RepID=A0A081G1F6_9GAMM|nr:hypothetical protein ADIMK_1064 [Marinobacterium lacunae]
MMRAAFVIAEALRRWAARFDRRQGSALRLLNPARVKVYDVALV